MEWSCSDAIVQELTQPPRLLALGPAWSWSLALWCWMESQSRAQKHPLPGATSPSASESPVKSRRDFGELERKGPDDNRADNVFLVEDASAHRSRCMQIIAGRDRRWRTTCRCRALTLNLQTGIVVIDREELDSLKEALIRLLVGYRLEPTRWRRTGMSLPSKKPDRRLGSHSRTR